MKIDLSDGIRITGDADELRGFGQDMIDAAEGVPVLAQVLTNDGVENVVIEIGSDDE